MKPLRRVRATRGTLAWMCTLAGLIFDPQEVMVPAFMDLMLGGDPFWSSQLALGRAESWDEFVGLQSCGAIGGLETGTEGRRDWS